MGALRSAKSKLAQRAHDLPRPLRGSPERRRPLPGSAKLPGGWPIAVRLSRVAEGETRLPLCRGAAVIIRGDMVCGRVDDQRSRGGVASLRSARQRVWGVIGRPSEFFLVRAQAGLWRRAPAVDRNPTVDVTLPRSTGNRCLTPVFYCSALSNTVTFAPWRRCSRYACSSCDARAPRAWSFSSRRSSAEDGLVRDPCRQPPRWRFVAVASLAWASHRANLLSRATLGPPQGNLAAPGNGRRRPGRLSSGGGTSWAR